jgi:hypothetical protein
MWPESTHVHRHQGVHEEPADMMDSSDGSAFSRRVNYLNERAQAIAERESAFELAVARERARRAEWEALQAGAATRDDPSHTARDKRRSPAAHGQGRAHSCGEELQQRVQGLLAQRDQLLSELSPLVRQDAESLAAAAAELGLDYMRLLRMLSATLQRYEPTVVSAACRRAFGSMEFAGEEAQHLDLDTVWVQAVASAQMYPRSQDGSSGFWRFRQRQRAQLHTPALSREPQQPAALTAASAQPACTTAQVTADSGSARSGVAATAQSAAIETLMSVGVDRATALAVLQQATGATPGLSGAEVRRAIAAAGEADNTEEPPMGQHCP